MKTIKTIYIAIFLGVISYGANAQHSNPEDKATMYVTSKDVSIGFFLENDKEYVYTCAIPDTQNFQYYYDKMITSSGVYTRVSERGYFSIDSSLYIVESKVKDSKNEVLFIVLNTDLKKGVATLEFRRPLISFKYTLTNEIDKNEKLYNYVN